MGIRDLRGPEVLCSYLLAVPGTASGFAYKSDGHLSMLWQQVREPETAAIRKAFRLFCHHFCVQLNEQKGKPCFSIPYWQMSCGNKGELVETSLVTSWQPQLPQWSRSCFWKHMGECTSGQQKDPELAGCVSSDLTWDWERIGGNSSLGFIRFCLSA